MRLAKQNLANGRANHRWRTRIDGRLRASLEIRDLIRFYERQLGKAARNPLVERQLRELAETEVLAARLRADTLRGEFTDVLAVNRLLNTCSRLRAALGLGGVSEPEGPGATDLAALLEAE